VRVARLLPTPTPARAVSPPATGNPLLAVGPRGHVLAVWMRKGRLEARMRTPAGRWGAIRAIGLAGPPPAAVHAAVAPDGRAIVAWGAVTGAEDQPTRWYFRAASTRSGASWRTARLEAFGGETGPLAPASALPAFDARGRGLVVWAGAAAVKIARPDGRRLQSLAVGGPVAVDDVAVSRTGEIAFAFSAPTPGQGPGPGPFVAAAPANGAFGVPVDVGAEGTAPLQGAQLAFDPVTGRPTVAWSALADGVARIWTATRE
jgi:hypothetical protein